jgi:hypothetical protein
MKPRTQAWKLFITCLYGTHRWIKRAPQGYLTVSVGDLATLLGRRPEVLHLDFEYLANQGLIDNLQWNGYYLTLKLIPPPSMAWLIGNSEPIIMEPIHE